MTARPRLALLGLTAMLLLPAGAFTVAAYHNPFDALVDHVGPPSCPLVLNTESFLFGAHWCAAWPRSAMDYALDDGNYWGSVAVPNHADLVLGGVGQASATINGNTRDCYGQSQFFLEASHKPGSFEPTVTFAYGGATAGPTHALACSQGQLRQPMRWHIAAPQGWEGAWSASLDGGSYAWSLSVGAPFAFAGGVARHVEYAFSSADGQQRHAFAGDVYEYR